MACNVAFAHLVAGLDGEQRKKFDEWLYAPEDGWDAAERRFQERLDQAT